LFLGLNVVKFISGPNRPTRNNAGRKASFLSEGREKQPMMYPTPLGVATVRAAYKLEFVVMICAVRANCDPAMVSQLIAH
jgi:hypothetical protein